MSSRDDILAAVRKNKPEATPLPEVPEGMIQFDDPTARFSATLAAVGGTALSVEDNLALTADFTERFADLKEVWSTLPGIPSRGEAAEGKSRNAEAWANLDLAVCTGHFAVAENGAIWVDLTTLPHPSVLALAEHLVIRVPADAIIANMHEAYDRIDSKNLDRYHVFLSGPSKTADIEQSLVIGAHGARSLIVYLVG